LAAKNCRAVKFFDDKIIKKGRDEPVLADETQILMLIGVMLKDGDDD
jgi:hypothetical protein